MEGRPTKSTKLFVGRCAVTPPAAIVREPLFLLGQKSFNQGLHTRLADRQGLVGGGAVHVVNVPILNAIRPSGKLFGHHRVVFGLLEGNDEIGVFKVDF